MDYSNTMNRNSTQSNEYQKIYELVGYNHGQIYQDFTDGSHHRKAWWGYQPYYPPNDEPGFVNEQFVRFVESRDNYLIRRPIHNITTLNGEFDNAVNNLPEYANKANDKLKFYKNLKKLQEYLAECGYNNEESILEETIVEDINNEKIETSPDEVNKFAVNLANRLNFGTPKYLGKGEHGYAYDVGNDKVMKITAEKSEAVESMKMKGKDLDHLAKVYNIYKSSLNNQEIFVILQEKINTSPKIKHYLEQRLNRLFYVFNNIFNVDMEDVLDFQGDIQYENLKDDIDAYMNKNPKDGQFFNQLLEIRDDLKKIGGISVEFMSPSNLGYKDDGTLAFFDAGFGEFDFGMEKPEELEIGEDGSTKFSTDSNVGGDQFPSYNNKSTEPSINNNLDANSAMYRENYEKNTENLQQNVEKNRTMSEEYLGDYSNRMYSGRNTNAEVFRNPKSIKRLKPSIRGIVAENGDLYVIDDAEYVIHIDFSKWLNSKGYPIPVDVYRNLYKSVPVQRYLDTNEFYLGESVEDDELERYKERFEEILGKAEKKNPTIDFVLEVIDNEEEPNINERQKAWIPGSKAVKVKQKCRLGGKGDGTSVACNQGDISNLEFSPLKEETELDSEFVSGWNRYEILHDEDVAGEMEVSNRDNHMILNKIYIKPEYRGMGYAKDAMKLLINYADKNNKIIALTPENTWGASKGKLKKWYSSLGFVMNKGRNADYQINGLMIRKPK